MKLRFLFISLLLSCLFPLTAYACPPGIPTSLAYIRRDDNRCEGRRERDASSAFSLISFITTDLNVDYPARLTIRVPGTNRTPPAILVQSFDRNYQLDNLATTQTSSGYTFSLSTTILKKIDVPIRSLRATAYITRDSSPIFFPVILGQASDSYEFVINNPQRTSFPTFEILRSRDRHIVYSNPRNTPQPPGHIRLIWKYNDAEPGNYVFHVVDGDGQSRSFLFFHDPNWFE